MILWWIYICSRQFRFFGENPNHKNLWYCLGYGANGILFTIMGGMKLSKFYKGEINDNMKLFKVDRFDK